VGKEPAVAVTVDWFEWAVPPRDGSRSDTVCGSSWQLREGARITARPGGALLLARFVLSSGTSVLTLAPSAERRAANWLP
jgi:hypothetical protein